MAKVLVNESSLAGIADAIRDKNGETTTYKPSEMAAAISAITTGGSGGGGEDKIPDIINISGNCSYMNYSNRWNWVFNNYSDRVQIKDVDNAKHMFSDSTELKKILTINFANTNINCSYMFYNCQHLEEIGDLNNLRLQISNDMFTNCHRLKYLPNFNNFTSKVDNGLYSSSSFMFNNCYSLREIPENFLSLLIGEQTSSYYAIYNSSFLGCVSLDEINGIPNNTSTLTNNVFSNTCSNCYRVKNITFALQEDGSVYTPKWRNQTLDLTIYTGYAPTGEVGKILDYNSGITADKEVTDDITYQALKNDPDWFTRDVAYSRYNHDSAVNTINSLPDCSAYLSGTTYTNTIKFRGDSGSATDGGAINTLTEEEIAVAAAKGWTVTLV